jgi:gliding motility-associated lipoprotein GldH
MRKMIQFSIFLAVISVGFYACDSARVFDQYRQIPESGWYKDSLVFFTVPVADTLQNHNLLIQIRNQTTYKYSNLWLFVEILQPDGIVLRDTFEIVLADHSGQWLGDGLGGIKMMQTMYRRGVYFPISGEYTISLQQGMRDEILYGIHDVGIRIEKISGRE